MEEALQAPPYTASPMPSNGQQDMAEMSFLDHLEELRWRIIKGLVGIGISAILCLFFADWVIDTLLLGPTRENFFMYRILGVPAETLVLQNRTLTGQFFAYWGTVLVVGLILGAPVFLYQLWKFIEPGLYPHEKAGMRFAALFATFFFMLGVSFGYLVLTPLAVQFFAQFRISESILNEFDISKYFSMVTTWTLGAGALFELPVVVYFLSKLGILTPALLRNSRKYALVIILAIAAFLTPPDPLSQIIMAVPLMLLYETSIWISAVVNRKRDREIAEALK